MFVKKIRAELRRWWDVQMTIRELEKLDSNELNDLGIGRWQIPTIAQNSSR